LRQLVDVTRQCGCDSADLLVDLGADAVAVQRNRRARRVRVLWENSAAVMV
jgi:hypothetical protein